MARGSIADLSLLFTAYHITWRKWKQASKASVSEKNGCKEIRPIFTPSGIWFLGPARYSPPQTRWTQSLQPRTYFFNH